MLGSSETIAYLHILLVLRSFKAILIMYQTRSRGRLAPAGSAQPQLSEGVGMPPTDLTTSQALEVLESQEIVPETEMMDSQGQRSMVMVSENVVGGTIDVDSDDEVDNAIINERTESGVAHALRPSASQCDISLYMSESIVTLGPAIPDLMSEQPHTNPTHGITTPANPIFAYFE